MHPTQDRRHGGARMRRPGARLWFRGIAGSGRRTRRDVAGRRKHYHRRPTPR